MKKKYVSLKVEVVKVQLSDCIAGSTVFTPTRGTSLVNELDGTRPGKRATFGKW